MRMVGLAVVGAVWLATVALDPADAARICKDGYFITVAVNFITTKFTPKPARCEPGAQSRLTPMVRELPPTCFLRAGRCSAPIQWTMTVGGASYVVAHVM
jgi:hypothetical protein